MAPTAMKERPQLSCDDRGCVRPRPITRQRKKQLQLLSDEEQWLTTSHKSIPESPNSYDTESRAGQYRTETNIARALVLVCVCVSVYHGKELQTCIDNLWDYLRRQPFFYSAYFESVYVTAVYALIIAVYPYAMHYISYLSRFKVKADVTYVHQTMFGLLKDAVVYLGPLFLADAAIQKKYTGVPEAEWASRSRHWVQTTRALPEQPPSLFQLCAHVAGAVFVFDALFFLLHMALHRNAFLYRHVHAAHHRHGALHAHVTNQLSVAERAAIVVAANYSLKLFSAHPFTRLVFVIVFLWLLVDNHAGYDLPWSPHRLVPGGVMGGPAKHHAHHVNGARHYQPFFTYLDNWLEGRDQGGTVTSEHMAVVKGDIVTP